MSAYVISTVSVSFASSTSENDVNRETLYAQYLEAAQEISAETGVTLTVIPMAEFEEDDWIPLDDFKEYLEYRANLQFEPVTYEIDSVPTRSTSVATKRATSTDGEVTLDITGSFRTELINGRQLFIGINYVTSELAYGSTGSWTQSSYTPVVLDGRRTYYITVGGTYRSGGIDTTHRANVYFYVKENGFVY